jgi:hypothetical protein
MSRNFEVLGKAGLERIPPVPHAQAPRTKVYTNLLDLLFQGPSALALIGMREGGAAAVCVEMAAELGASGKRVLIVAVEYLLRMDQVVAPDQGSFALTESPNVWRWPASGTKGLEFFKPRPVDPPANWIGALRRTFDAILLDCPSLEQGPVVAELAAMAGKAVMVVEAGQTGRQQIKNTQQILQLRGVPLSGSILISR